MEVEEVTHAFRWIASRGDKPYMPSSSQIQRDCYEKWNENLHWNVSMVDIHLRKLWPVYGCPGHAGMKGNAGQSNPHNSGLLRGRSANVEKLETLPAGRTDKAKDTTPLIAWRRGVERGSARRSFLRGPSPVRRTLEPFQRQRWGELLRDGVERIWCFRAHRYHLELLKD